MLVDDDEHIVDSSFDSNLSFMSSLLQSSKYRSQAYAHYDSNNHRQLTWDMSVYLPAMCGVLVLGIGDSMASLVGVWVGRLKWFNINRTVEGTAAAITSIMGFTYCMVRGFQFVNEIMLGGSLIILDPVRDTATSWRMTELACECALSDSLLCVCVCLMFVNRIGLVSSYRLSSLVYSKHSHCRLTIFSYRFSTMPR